MIWHRWSFKVLKELLHFRNSNGVKEEETNKDRNSLINSLLNNKDEKLRLLAAQILNATEVEKPPKLDGHAFGLTDENSFQDENKKANPKAQDEETSLGHDKILTDKEINEKDSKQSNSADQRSHSTKGVKNKIKSDTKETHESQHEFSEPKTERQETFKNGMDPSKLMVEEENTLTGHKPLSDVQAEQTTHQLKETQQADLLHQNEQRQKIEIENEPEKEALPLAGSNENNKEEQNEPNENEASKETFDIEDYDADNKFEKHINGWKEDNTERKLTGIKSDIVTNRDENSDSNEPHIGDNTDVIINTNGQRTKGNEDGVASVEDSEKKERNEEESNDEPGNEPISHSEESSIEKDESEHKDEQVSDTENLNKVSEEGNRDNQDTENNFKNNAHERINEIKDSKSSHSSITQAKHGVQTNPSFTAKSPSSSSSTATTISSTTTTTSTTTTATTTSSTMTKPKQSTSSRNLNYERSSDRFSTVPVSGKNTKSSRTTITSTSLGASKLTKPKPQACATKSTATFTLTGRLSTTLSSLARKKDGSGQGIKEAHEKNACSIDRYEPRHENLFFGFPTRVDSNRPVKPQKLGRGLKFRIQKLEVVYYLGSEQ